MDQHQDFVEESRFGVWFLNTEIWHVHVLQRAMNDLERLLPQRKAIYPVILDVGCGSGKSLIELSRRFHPEQLIAIDADPQSRDRVENSIQRCAVAVEFHQSNAARLPLASDSVDMVFCHQTLHHIVAQEDAINEFFRVLKPGGVLLLAESTRAYIYSWIIRVLFRHPMHVQRTADEYLQMLCNAGFNVAPECISLPYLWWSRSDLGFKEWLGFSLPRQREETLVNLVAIKP